MTRRTSVCRGYTLVELLLVVVIIALLAALLLPVLQAARRASAGAVCMGHLRQLGQAYSLYYDDYGQYPDPPHAVQSVKDKRLLLCPADDGREQLASSYAFRTLVPPTLRPYWEQLDLSPATVLAACGRHTERERSPQVSTKRAPYPYKLVLRASGSVQRVPLEQIREVAVGGSQPTFIRVYPGEPGYDLALR